MPGPCLVGVKQPVPEFDQSFQVTNVADPAPGIDAPQEQHFCSKISTDPGHIPLIEQRLADGAVWFRAQPPYRLDAIPVGPEKIRSQVANDPWLLAGADQLDHP